MVVALLTVTPRDPLKILLPVSTTFHSQDQRLKDAMKNILRDTISSEGKILALNETKKNVGCHIIVQSLDIEKEMTLFC